MTTAVRADVWPAEVMTDPDAPDPADRRRAYPVRVVVTLDEILVFEDGSPPRLAFRDQLVSYSPGVAPHQATPAQLLDPSSRWAIATTEEGHAVSFARASGCGCGSRLKALSLQALLQLGAPAAGASVHVSAASTRDR